MLIGSPEGGKEGGGGAERERERRKETYDSLLRPSRSSALGSRRSTLLSSSLRVVLVRVLDRLLLQLGDVRMVCLVCFDRSFGVAAHANQQKSRSVRARRERARGRKGTGWKGKKNVRSELFVPTRSRVLVRRTAALLALEVASLFMLEHVRVVGVTARRGQATSRTPRV